MFLNVPELIKRYAPFIPGLPPPATAHDDAPAVCVRINETWIPLVLGALETLTWADLYEGTESEREHAAREAQNLMVSVALGNMDCQEDFMYLLRQKPGNPCVLQQSVDNGFTWTDAFDYSLCMAAASQPSSFELSAQASAYASVMVEIQDTYDGTVGSIAPGLVYDESELDELRDMAMCYAINVFVAVLAQEIEAQQDHGLNWRDIAKIAAFAVGVSAAIIQEIIEFSGKSAPPHVVLALAIAEALSAGVLALIDLLPDEPDLQPLLDSDVQHYVVCHMVEKLHGQTPGLALFSSVYDDVDPEIVGDDVALLLQSLVGSERMYLAFLAYVQGSFESIEGGQSFNCDCVDSCDFEIDYDVLEPTTYIYGARTGAKAHNGNYSQSSEAYVGENGQPGRRLKARVDNVPECGVSKLEGWVWVKHGNSNGLVAITVELYDADDVMIATETLSQSGVREVWRSWSISVYGNASYFVYDARFTSSLPGAQDLYIDDIVVS